MIFSKNKQPANLTIHFNLHRYTLQSSYDSYHGLSCTLTRKFSTRFYICIPQLEVLPGLWQLLRTPEPLDTPVGPMDIGNAASEVQTLPSEDPGVV